MIGRQVGLVYMVRKTMQQICFYFKNNDHPLLSEILILFWFWFFGSDIPFTCNSQLSDCKDCVYFRSSHPEVFLEKAVLKICSKFTGEHPCRSAISIKLQSDVIEIALRHGCSPVNWSIFSEHLFLRTLLVGCFWYFTDHTFFKGIKFD